MGPESTVRDNISLMPWAMHALSQVSVQQLRANPFVKRCLAEHETDLAEIFEEEDKGDLFSRVAG